MKPIFNMKENSNSLELFNYLHNDIQCNWIMSNSNCNVIKEHFINHQIIEILARRAINSKKPDSKTIELLIIKPNI